MEPKPQIPEQRPISFNTTPEQVKAYLSAIHAQRTVHQEEGPAPDQSPAATQGGKS